ncbi:MAG: T9SS type A sorting domain-containing protein [Bacteroidetes bacterium]|nr:T9SS type A sorting domain-containing protein [Bacteroidota bacterium]
MKKFLLLTTALFLICLTTRAQDTLYIDDFESYTLGGYLAVQSSWWTTWSGGTGGSEDAIISDEQALSPTQSVKVEGLTDLILLLGNQISGKYQVNFYYYIPSGYGGYYNFQHYESPGVEWALEVYFGETGDGYIHAGGQNVASFTYNHDEWIFCKNIIDLDNDVGELWIAGTFVHTWQWSLTSQGQPGANQLGGLDIYAGAPPGETPLFYMDDIIWLEVEPSTDPIIEVTPDIFNEIIEPGQVATQPMTIANIGVGELEFDIAIVYNIAAGEKSQLLTSNNSQKTYSKALLSNNQVIEDSDYNPSASTPAPSDDVILHYDGDNNSAIGLINPAEFQVAAMFPNSLTVPHAGMELTSIEIFINDPADAFALRVYGQGTSYEPGELLVDQPFTPVAYAWNTIALDVPVVITGEDIWVGYWINQTVTDIFPAGCDMGPADPNGNWIKSGIAWTHLSYDYNWNIRAHLTGEPIEQWLSVDPASGTVLPDEPEEVTVTFDAANLELGTYAAEIQINNNDPVTPQFIVPVTLDVVAVGINEVEKNEAVLIYPNPATDFINISSTSEINSVKLINYIGQTIHNKIVKNQKVRINTADYNAGIYFLQIKTNNTLVTKQIIIK